MARYIDADELRRRVKEKTNPYGKPTLDYESGVKVMNMIDNAPTADVVPKSEVEKLQNELVIWKQNRFNLYQKLECYEMARQKVASEIFAEIEKLHLHITNEFDLRRYNELKKKYTEGENEKA